MVLIAFYWLMIYIDACKSVGNVTAFPFVLSIFRTQFRAFEPFSLHLPLTLSLLAFLICKCSFRHTLTDIYAQLSRIHRIDQSICQSGNGKWNRNKSSTRTLRDEMCSKWIENLRTSTKSKWNKNKNETKKKAQIQKTHMDEKSN